jgi:hypothetical protein
MLQGKAYHKKHPELYIEKHLTPTTKTGRQLVITDAHLPSTHHKHGYLTQTNSQILTQSRS